jgi:hypothetical protein
MQIYKAIPLELYNSLMEKQVVNNERELYKKLTSKGKRLLLKIIDSNKLQWNLKGELLFENQYVSGSSIVDLINFFTTNEKKKKDLVGLDLFIESLVDIPLENLSLQGRNLINKVKPKKWIRFQHGAI